MKTLVFATNNKHKLEEISSLAARGFHIISLAETGCTEDIPETEPTLEGNALLKARYVHSRFGHDCFADDTGLEIDALNGRPGVYSARYGGKTHDFEANMDKVLAEMKGMNNRKARFRTVMALIMDNQEFLFEGIVQGNMLTERHGTEGFGYDPIFQPAGTNLTFAEMTMEEKNTMSHRARAVSKLAAFLQERADRED